MFLNGYLSQYKKISFFGGGGGYDVIKLIVNIITHKQFSTNVIERFEFGTLSNQIAIMYMY